MLSELAWRGFGFAYGIFNLVVMAFIAGTRDKAFSDRTSEEEKRELSIAQKKYWDVKGQPILGFHHDFYTANGVKLHYVVNAPSGRKAQRVAIFIHGFPDSFLLWRAILASPKLQDYTLIAVDLPGYGGSDDLPIYDPENVLQSLAGFILGMRELYLAESGKLVMVTHDWGGIVGARLASEAKELADRWIIAGAIIPQQVYSNVLTHIASAKQMIRTFFHWPFRPALVKSSLRTLSPVFGQIARSFYIFILQLPFPLAQLFTRFGNFWFLRVLHLVQARIITSKGKKDRRLTEKEKAEWMVVSSGPGVGQFPEGEASKEHQGYSESVKQRIKDFGLRQKIRIYREHLALNPWEKSLATIVALSEIEVPPSRSNSGAGLFEDGPPGALKVPATLIYGKHDPAFEGRLALEGISDYLVKGSQVLTVQKGAHWLPFEEEGINVLVETTLWALGDEKESLNEGIRRSGEEVKWVAEK
ncbi:alpha/beta-hydrolase [Lojkania enalia]|uniref:Alpha/beta-hydrolase n=1 Tax=Lojkania enalia TaxID=147567 RepID=A0A9P4N8I1_9PLEO|nr:alpha/beta-hydrolase [Didymosphaeria enalia]